MSLQVKITIKNGDKEAQLELNETDNLTKLVIIQNVFNLFGIDKDIFEIIKEHDQIGKAYKHFFDNLNAKEEPLQITGREDLIQKSEEIRERLIEGLQQEDLQEVYQSEEDSEPEWFKSGVKVDEDGRKRYRCRYHCYICMNKGNHYIYEGTTEIKCHSCGVAMPVKPAHPDGFPNRDTHGNFFRAGEYFDWKLS